MTPQEEKAIAKHWYRQGVIDTVKDVNQEGIDNDFELLYGVLFKIDSFLNECPHCQISPVMCKCCGEVL